MKCLLVVAALCVVSTCYADKVIEGVRNIGPQQSNNVVRFGAVSARFAGEGREPSIRVKDIRHAAKDCSVSWYEADVECMGAVQFKGIADCSKPVSVKQSSSDCGAVKVTKVKFTSGHSVEITKKNGKVTVDYDD